MRLRVSELCVALASLLQSQPGPLMGFGSTSPMLISTDTFSENVCSQQMATLSLILGVSLCGCFQRANLSSDLDPLCPAVT